jgi:hypothetical protein
VSAFPLPEADAAALGALARRAGVSFSEVLSAALFSFDQLREATRARLVWGVLTHGEEERRNGSLLTASRRGALRHRLALVPAEARRWLQTIRLGSPSRAPLSRAQVFGATVRLFLNLPGRDQEALVADYLRLQPPAAAEGPPGPDR